MLKSRRHTYNKGAAAYEGGLFLVFVLVTSLIWYGYSHSESLLVAKKPHRMCALTLANNVLSYLNPIHHSLLLSNGESTQHKILSRGQWKKDRAPLFQGALPQRMVGVLSPWVKRNAVSLNVSVSKAQIGEGAMLRVVATVSWQEGKDEVKVLSLPRCYGVAP